MVKSWRKAVDELLKAADHSQAELAEELHIKRPNVTRWLTGKVTPTAASMRAINKATARLIGEPEVETYLSAFVVLESFSGIRGFESLDANQGGRIMVLANQLLGEYSGFFEENVQKVLADFIHSDLSKAFRLCVALTIARGQQIVKRLKGSVTKRPLFEEIVWLCRQFGLDLTPLIKHDGVSEALRSRERAYFEIDRILSDFSVPTEERVQLTQKLHVFTNKIFAAVAPRTADRPNYYSIAIAKLLEKNQ